MQRDYLIIQSSSSRSSNNVLNTEHIAPEPQARKALFKNGKGQRNKEELSNPCSGPQSASSFPQTSSCHFTSANPCSGPQSASSFPRTSTPHSTSAPCVEEAQNQLPTSTAPPLDEQYMSWKHLPEFQTSARQEDKSEEHPV